MFHVKQKSGGDGPGPVLVFGASLLCVVALSMGAILIRSASSEPLVTAWYRVGISMVLLAPLCGRAPLPSARWGFAGIAGLALALHFWTWMISLDRTSVASSTLLVTTSPLWVALAAVWLPGEVPLSRRGWLGAIICFGGGAVLTMGGGGPSDPTGNLFALLGAMLAAVYFLASRRAREGLSVTRAALIVNAIAWGTLTPFVLASGAPITGFDVHTWLALVLLALVPQLIGHNVILWLLRWVSTTTVTLLVLLEPVGASLLAWPLFGERPGPSELAGGSLLLLGLSMVVRSRRSEQPR